MTSKVQAGQRWITVFTFHSTFNNALLNVNEIFEILYTAVSGNHEVAAIKLDGSQNIYTVFSNEILKNCCPTEHILLPTGINAWINESIPASNFFNKRCECGAHSIGLDKHSDYCPLYSRD